MLVNTNQLREMHKHQLELDKSILDAKGLTNEEVALKRRIALLVEFGEFLQELPTTFKFWKDTAVDDRKKALEELSDCIHFALSVTTSESLEVIIEQLQLNNEFFFDPRLKESKDDVIRAVTGVIFEDGGDMIAVFLMLAYVFDFKWSDIYKAYLAKLEVNKERLNSGY